LFFTACALLVFAATALAQSPQSAQVPEVAQATVRALPGVARIEAHTKAFGPVPVWLFQPEGAGRNAPVVVVFHGVRRDAHRYLSEWIPVAQANGIVVVAPEFTREQFPGVEGYNLGYVRNEDGVDRRREAWSFGVVEAAFDAACTALGLSTDGYLLFGHSAGAQFAHRFVTWGGGPRMIRAVIANAGWYTIPTTAAAFPYGMNGAPAGADLDRALAAPVTILLGTADVDPQHPSLNRDPPAMAQGAHRFARGMAYFAAAKAEAKRRGVAFGWTCATAPGIGHDNGGMARFAAPILLTGAPGPNAPACQP
jgi:poly(3-hydroxybutyrate) depolymerase